MTVEADLVSGVSVSHTDASLDQLETVAGESQRESVATLLAEPGVEEAFVLQTCNRVEAYVVTHTTEAGRDALDGLIADAPGEIAREMGHEESLRHLLRVAAGLESLVLGEDQILGQVRDAYEDARAAGGVGPLLDDAVTKAIRAGERARTETEINEGVVSLASAAVRLAAETQGLDGRSALVVGTGEMGTIAVERLAGRVDRLVVANRTRSRAQRLAETVVTDENDVDVEAIDLENLPDALEIADVVISATGSPDHVVAPSAFESIDETLVVDIARPRDVPPTVEEFPELTVYDLDSLESVTEKTRRMRRRAAERGESIVDEEFERLLVQYKRQRADSVISAMYESAERVKARELETAFGKLDLDEESEAVVESMVDSVVSQLLAPPTNSLRDAAEEDDWSTIHTALQLFDPNFEEGSEPPAFVQGMDFAELNPDEIPEGVREQIPPAVLERIED